MKYQADELLAMVKRRCLPPVEMEVATSILVPEGQIFVIDEKASAEFGGRTLKEVRDALVPDSERQRVVCHDEETAERIREAARRVGGIRLVGERTT